LPKEARKSEQRSRFTPLVATTLGVPHAESLLRLELLAGQTERAIASRFGASF
jgi:hypothetical protein